MSKSTKALIQAMITTSGSIYALVLVAIVAGYSNTGFFALHAAGGLCLLNTLLFLIFSFKRN